MPYLVIKEDSAGSPQLARVIMPSGATAPRPGDLVTFPTSGMVETRRVTTLNVNVVLTGWEYQNLVEAVPLTTRPAEEK